MKNVIKLFLVIVSFFLISSCQKDGKDDTSATAPYDTQYQNGITYTQSFYVGSHFITHIETGIGVGYNLISVCNRIMIEIKEGGENFIELRPDQDFYNEIVRKNNELRNTELKYYAVANIKFLYNYGQPSNLERMSDWKMVIGKMEEYVLDGKIYKHLVVVGENL